MTLPAKDDGAITGGVIAADEAIDDAERTEGDGVGDGVGIDKLRLSGRAADVPIEWGFSPGASNFSLASNSGGGLEVDGGRETEAGDVMFNGSGLVDDKLLGRRLDCGSLGCARLMMRAHVATLMFIWL
jgi:hypothetical protein